MQENSGQFYQLDDIKVAEAVIKKFFTKEVLRNCCQNPRRTAAIRKSYFCEAAIRQSVTLLNVLKPHIIQGSYQCRIIINLKHFSMANFVGVVS